MPRKVKPSTILNILKKKPIPMFFGFGFSSIPAFIVSILLIVFSVSADGTPKVDHDLISSEGREITAVITDIETQYNVTINNVHPTIIFYKYSENGKEIESSYKVLEERRIQNLEIGDDLVIKELDGNSIIKSLKPYDFSLGFLLLIPLPFLIIGLPFLIYSIYHLQKELKLFKYGKVSSGRVVSMIQKSGLPISNIGQGIIVHYEYETNDGNKVIGESFTMDFSILGDEKNGDFIPIFVSTERDDKSCVIPKLEAFRNGWNIDFEQKQ